MSASPRMTSTSGRLATGLKKWRPTNWLGRSRPLAKVSSRMLEVLVAISAVGGKRGSSSPNRARFASAFSTMASITRSAEPISAAARSTRRRAAAASASPGARKRLRNSSPARANAGSTYCCARSCSVTRSPLSAHHAAMSPPIVPAPTTWTWLTRLSFGARLRNRSRSSNTCTRLRQVRVTSSLPIDSASARNACSPRAPYRSHRSTIAYGAG